jgi:hypothetical protein
MVWVKIDDHFDEHPKWADAPGDSIALWVAAMAWCNRNDSTEGYIPAFKLEGRVKVRNLKATVADLVKRDAFHPAEGGYVIHDYPEFQQPEKVREIRQKRSRAGKRGAAARWGAKANATEYAEAPAHTDAMANDIANEMPSDMANEMPNAMANGCPVPRSPFYDLHLPSTSSSRVPVAGNEDEQIPTYETWSMKRA